MAVEIVREAEHAARRDGGGPSRAARNAALASIVVLLAAFVALGIWQLQRRTWKLDLIERVEQRVHAAPSDAPDRERWATIDRADDEYRHVRVTGVFVDDRATKVLAVTEYGRGAWLLVPLRLANGDFVLVNRGFVTDTDRPRRSSTAPVTVTGLLRLTEPRGSFLHDNDPAHDRWYSRDVRAIAGTRGLQGAPYFIDADASPAASPGEPIGGLTVIAFRNDHLVYAVTWFVLAGLCGWAVWRLLHPQERYDSHE